MIDQYLSGPGILLKTDQNMSALLMLPGLPDKPG
jgi:hypothetical protein